MKTRVTLVAIVAAAALLGACGGDGGTTVTETVTTPAQEPPATTAEPPATGTGPSTSTSPTTTEGAGGGCGTQGPYRVRVVRGDVSCAQARAAVSGYDQNGSKVQQVGAYTCEGGEADVRPVVFTCVSGQNEIVASEG